MSNTKSYFDVPCERCGSKKKVSKTWTEEIATSFGSSSVEVMQTTCSNPECEKLFVEARAEELVKINARKALKEEQDVIRKKNIATAIAAKKKLKEEAVKNS